MKFYNGDIIRYKENGNACLYFQGKVYWLTTSMEGKDGFDPTKMDENRYWNDAPALSREDGITLEEYRGDFIKLGNVCEIIAAHLNEYGDTK